MDWRNVLTTFKERRVHLMESALFTDCAFSVGPKRIHFMGHKLLLAMASPVFGAIFYPTPDDTDYDLDDILRNQDLDAFKKLLQYIYTDKVEVHNYTEARELHRTSKKFAMVALERICVDEIRRTVTTETACNLLEYSRAMNTEELALNALEIIIQHTKKVITAPSFNEISIDTLEEILCIDELHVDSEVELINAVINWGRENSNGEALTRESLRALAGPAVRQLRVLTLTPREVAEDVADLPLLSDAECLAVLKLVATPPPGRVPIPDGLCPCRRKRGPSPRAGHGDCDPRNPPCGTRRH